MVTRKSKPSRACPMCKWYKYVGNNKEATKPSIRRQLQVGKDERRRQ